jgi:Stress responsive A/B Barrel Domain.
MTYNRRKFITLTATLTAGMSASAIMQNGNQVKKQVIHHVFFWLKNPGSKEDLQKLLDGLRTLRKIETVKRIYIGVPAETEHRPVVDSSFSASELMFFDDLAGQKVYQDHPIHRKFVADCSHLWEKVIVYDVSDI